MADSAGDFALGDTIDIKFTTRAFATGLPTLLTGTPAVVAYPDNSTTQITAGITLTTSFDSADLVNAGLNNVRIVATSGNGYASGVSYTLVISVGTVGGTDVRSEVVGSFTIERGAAYKRLGAPAGNEERAADDHAHGSPHHGEDLSGQGAARA